MSLTSGCCPQMNDSGDNCLRLAISVLAMVKLKDYKFAIMVKTQICFPPTSGSFYMFFSRPINNSELQFPSYPPSSKVTIV